jgi:putative membrane protein
MRVRNRIIALFMMSLWLSLSAACGRDDSGSATPLGPPSVNTDREIGAIVTAANEGEIKLGEIAVQRALNDDVRRHAVDMLSEHTAMLERQTALFNQIGYAPRDNATSLELRHDSDQMYRMLQELTGGFFDRAYVEAQVAAHAKLLSLLDVQLLPKAQNELLRGDLTKMRADVAVHLQHAQTLMGRIP